MFFPEDIALKPDCALSLSWKKGTAQALPRRFHALSFRIRGNADYTCGDAHLHAGTDDVLFVPAHRGYTLTANTDEQVMAVHFYLDAEISSGMQVFHPLNPEIFRRLFSELCACSRDKSPGCRYKSASLLYKIFEQLEIQKTKAELSGKPAPLQEALEYLRENFSSPETTVESVAGSAGVSAVYLRKLFRTAIGETPIRYLTKLRVDYAHTLLQTGYYSVEEVTTLSGFGDAKYFSSVYKKYTGVPPSAHFGQAFAHGCESAPAAGNRMKKERGNA